MIGAGQSRCWLLAVLLCAATPQVGALQFSERLSSSAQAQEPLHEWPPVSSIVFEGNGTTRRHVLMREVYLRVGDPADPGAIESSRQAIQDLGLFRSVSVDQQAEADGVALVFTVEEKWYLLPYPRLDYNADRELAYGFKLDWSNVAGLNHRLEALISRQQNAEADRGEALEYDISYFAPYFLRSPYDISLGISQDQTPIIEDVPDATGEGANTIRYEEDYATLTALMLRRLTPGQGSQGWRVGGGVFWQQEELRGASAPAENGGATALVALAQYRRITNRLYSEVGRVFTIRGEFATPDLVSDYDYVDTRISYYESRAVGDMPHQTVAFIGNLGSYHGGPRDFDQYALGGGDNLRGYDKNVFEGDAFWSVSLEYQRPLFGFYPVRGLLIVDAGRTYADGLDGLSLNDIKVDAGIGLRWRIQTFVDLTLEIGMAWPLTDGGAEPFFGKL